MDKNELLITRSRNLQRILATRFDGDSKSFAEKIGVSAITFSKYLNSQSDRPCNDKAARKIENILGLSTGYLDEKSHRKKDVYYIALYTNSSFTYETIKALQIEKDVLECSCVLGDYDIFLKIEIEDHLLLDMLLARIAKFPGVKRTQTISSVTTLRWQRAQREDMNLIAKKEAFYSQKGLEEVIFKKMDHYFSEIRELSEGEISVKDNDIISFKPYQIIKGAEQHILTTIDLKHYKQTTKKALETEEKLIAKGVRSKKIIFLCHKFKENWETIKHIYDEFFKIGSSVRFSPLDQWIETPLSGCFEEFTIIDNEYVCVRRESQKRYLIKRTTNIIKPYINSFKANWDNSLSLVEIEEQFKSHSLHPNSRRNI